jgi:hypothetical protein
MPFLWIGGGQITFNPGGDLIRNPIDIGQEPKPSTATSQFLMTGASAKQWDVSFRHSAKSSDPHPTPAIWRSPTLLNTSKSNRCASDPSSVERSSNVAAVLFVGKS